MVEVHQILFKCDFSGGRNYCYYKTNRYDTRVKFMSLRVGTNNKSRFVSNTASLRVEQRPGGRARERTTQRTSGGGLR